MPSLDHRLGFPYLAEFLSDDGEKHPSLYTPPRVRLSCAEEAEARRKDIDWAKAINKELKLARKKALNNAFNGNMKCSLTSQDKPPYRTEFGTLIPPEDQVPEVFAVSAGGYLFKRNTSGGVVFRDLNRDTMWQPTSLLEAEIKHYSETTTKYQFLDFQWT